MKESNEQENDEFLDNDLNELNKIIQSANQLAQQLGGTNPFLLMQQQYGELVNQQIPVSTPLPAGPVINNPATVILHCINKSQNPLPKFENASDSGFALCANLSEPVVLWPMTMKAIPTGLYFEVPNGYEIQLRPRVNQILIMGQSRNIDSGHRGEIEVMLFNLGKNDIQINHGDRIAQAVVCPVIGSGKLTILETRE